MNKADYWCYMQELLQIVLSFLVFQPSLSLFASALRIYTYTRTSIRPTCPKGFNDGNGKHIRSTKASRLDVMVNELIGVKKRNIEGKEGEASRERGNMVVHSQRQKSHTHNTHKRFLLLLTSDHLAVNM